MKKLSKKLLAILSAILVIALMPISTSAETLTKYTKKANSYEVTSMTTSYAVTREKRINSPGIKKTSYTYGSFTVTSSQTFSFSVSATLSATYKGQFCDVGASLGVTNTVSTTVSAGTTIYIDKSAPNGIYYGYICVPQKKVHFKVQNCSLNYTSWTTKYEKTFDYAPQKDLEYITVKRVTD